MKIGQPSDNALQMQLGNLAASQKPSLGANAPSRTAVRGAEGSPAAGASVTVSPLARGLERAGRAELADIDLQKVAAVRASIEAGTYVISPEAIGDKLLSNAQELLSRKTDRG